METISELTIMRLDWGNEVTRDESGALVDQLVECMLSIGARLSPDNWPSAVSHPGATPGHILPIALHVSLLEVSCKSVKVLVIGKQSMRLRAIEVAIPDTQQSKDNRDVALKRSSLEMVVHPVSSGQQVFKVVKSNVEGTQSRRSR